MPRETTLRHVRSREFRHCTVDGATTVLLSDLVGDRVQLTFTRMDVVVTGERVQILDNGQIQMISGVIPESEQQKTVEFSTEMRPDIAVQVLNGLISCLQNLPSGRRKAYGVPETLPDPVQLLPVRDR